MPLLDSIVGSGGVAAAAVALAGLLLAHAISGMTNTELLVFFGLDFLLALAVFTANPMNGHADRDVSIPAAATPA